MIIVSPVLCRLLSFVVPIGGITLFPFILLAQEPDPITVNHEKIHIRQQMELLVIFFYILYVGEWLWHRSKGKSGTEAYEALRFEREAYAHQKDEEYLKKRKFLAWREQPLLD